MRGEVTAETEWIAVDWGTSNLRVWGIDVGGRVLFSRASAQGMGKLTPDAYPGFWPTSSRPPSRPPASRSTS
jgi:hypothetical protein